MEIDIKNIKPPNHILPALLSANTKPSIHTVDMIPYGHFILEVTVVTLEVTYMYHDNENEI